MDEATSEKTMTHPEVLEFLRQTPEGQELLESCYLDHDLSRAAKRFYSSDEFRSVLRYARRVRTRGKGQRLVLDLGGGSGFASLAWFWAGYRVVIVDPEPSEGLGLASIGRCLELTRDQIHPCRGTGEQLPFADAVFDIIYSREVLHHASDLTKMCNEIYRVLKAGGLFMGTREHVISQRADLELFLKNHPSHRYTKDECAYLRQEYMDAISKGGFRSVTYLDTWESAVNYYPVPRSEFQEGCRKTLCKYLGGVLGRRLASLESVQGRLGRYWSKEDHTPGRLYSFLALK